jgi:hypothetical protein
MKGENMKTKIIIIAGCATLSLLSACITSPICATSSVTPIQNRVITENMGAVSGEDSTYSVLGIYMISRPDIDKAIAAALKSKDADTLINVRCYETTKYFVLFSKSTIRVEGEAVKLASSEVKEPVKGKTK